MRRPVPLSVGMVLASVFLFGLGMIRGQDITPMPPTPVSGVWLGNVIMGDTLIAGEIAFVVDATGTVYSGGVLLEDTDATPTSYVESCIARFESLTEASDPVRGYFESSEYATGIIKLTNCDNENASNAMILQPALAGTWEAAPADAEHIAEAVRIFARQPADTVASGEDLFNLRCSACHGIAGVGTEIAPPFVDFYALPYDFIEVRVRSGTDVMSAFDERVLPNNELNDIVTYIQEELVQTGIRAYTDEELDEGRELYVDRCAECHGSQGQGTNDFGPPLLIWPPYSVTGIYEGARIPLPEMGRVRVSNAELDLIAGYYILQMASGN